MGSKSISEGILTCLFKSTLLVIKSVSKIIKIKISGGKIVGWLRLDLLDYCCF